MIHGLTCALLAGGCSSGDGGLTLVTPSDDPRRNVMVIDTGIDTAAGELRGKIAGAFTIRCSAPPASQGDGSGGADGGAAPPSFEEIKRQYLADLAVPDDDCHLAEGISGKPDPLPGIRRYRDRWNRMLREELYASDVFTSAEWDSLTAGLDQGLESFPYHGTSTAGTVAHDNPEVRLILVERELGDAKQYEQSFQCMQQADIDQTVALFTDADVREAYVHAPLSAYESELQAAITRLGVGIINESYGRAARGYLEALQLSKGCAPVELAAYYSAIEGIERAHNDALAMPVLVVQSAGNESSLIDSAADSFECDLDHPRKLLVGSTSVEQAISSFSNFGACVDLYVPGEDMVADYAGGWRMVVQGTSFSAPLLARELSRAGGAAFDPAQARLDLLARYARGTKIPIGTFPRDFFFVPGARGTTLGALTIASGAGGAGTAAPPRARARAVSQLELHRTLAPLLRLRGRARR